jgi:MFS transporter, ACS family, D-galactonate transporter
VDRGTFNSAFFWAYAALQIPAGWVVVLVPGICGYCVCAIGRAANRSARDPGRRRIGCGTGQLQIDPFQLRGKGTRSGRWTLHGTGTKIGPAIGPPLAAWLILKYGWRIMFVILGLGGLVWLVPWLALVQNDARWPAKDRPNIAPAAPIRFGRLMASPVVGTVIATFCYMYFVYFSMTWMPAYFVEQRHQSLAKMGLYTFSSFAGMAIMAAVGGWAADWLIRRGGNPVIVRKWCHNCGLRHRLHGADWCSRLFFDGGGHFRHCLALRPGARDP